MSAMQRCESCDGRGWVGYRTAIDDADVEDCVECAGEGWVDPFPCCTNTSGSGLHRHTETCITGEA